MGRQDSPSIMNFYKIKRKWKSCDGETLNPEENVDRRSMDWNR